MGHPLFWIVSFLRFYWVLRWLSDTQFVSIFLVSTFKRKFLTSSRSIEIEFVNIFKIQVFWAVFSQAWLRFAHIDENCWFPQLYPIFEEFELLEVWLGFFVYYQIYTFLDFSLFAHLNTSSELVIEV